MVLSEAVHNILYDLELLGLSVCTYEVWFDGSVNPGVTETIIKTAEDLGKQYGITNQPILFPKLIILDNDPLLATIRTVENYLPPVKPFNNSYTARNAVTVLHTFNKPMSSIEIDLTAAATTSAGCTIRAFYDLMSKQTWDMVVSNAVAELDSITQGIQALAQQKKTANTIIQRIMNATGK